MTNRATFEEIKKCAKLKSQRGVLRNITDKLGDFFRYFDTKEDPLTGRHINELQFIRNIARAYAECEEENPDDSRLDRIRAVFGKCRNALHLLYPDEAMEINNALWMSDTPIELTKKEEEFAREVVERINGQEMSGDPKITLRELRFHQVLVDGNPIGSVDHQDNGKWGYRRFGAEDDSDNTSRGFNIDSRGEAIDELVADWKKYTTPCSNPDHDKFPHKYGEHACPTCRPDLP